ncbi:MAG: multicopper oxidase family protein [Alphaproteobacteria bacterium]|nr:multicopper oxidase family protein [Alphaproteobacteria bacterium]
MRSTRRHLLKAAAALPLAAHAWPARAAAPRTLVARPARVNLVGPAYPDTEVWSFDGTVPGPIIRIRQGARLRVDVRNELSQDTTVHWHGIRLPNAMDGVPHLTQKPIAPGETFTYDFAAPDAGTYWYHPHSRSFEQVARGLYGALIVEEAEPPPVDRDEVWVLADWRLDRDARIQPDFGNLRDLSHDGRVGNTMTLNGQVRDDFRVAAGERLRLRLINAASARVTALEFKGHQPVVIALDGHPIEPQPPEGGRIVLGPGMRADILLDAAGMPGERYQVVDTWYRGREYRLVDLVYDDRRRRDRPPQAFFRLPANKLPEPDLDRAERREVVFSGGAMGGMTAATLDGERLDPRALIERGKAWAVNGVAAGDHDGQHDVQPFLTLRRGTSCVLAMANDTSWPHPIHLHGHAFRVLSVNGQPSRLREWRDTVLMQPREKIDIAFVADNPGDWMFHCHILDHQQGGMMAHVRVA